MTKNTHLSAGLILQSNSIQIEPFSHASLLMQKRIKTTPQYVSPPLSNILMSLEVPRLREILFEIISWDTTGKDIFNAENIFQDPIDVRFPIIYPF